MLAQKMISKELTGMLTLFIQRYEVDVPKVQDMLNATDGEINITYQQWWDALTELRDATEFEPLGLVLGDCIAPEFSGVLGYLSLTSLTLDDALNYFERYQHLLYGGTGAKIERSANTILCQWEPSGSIYNKELDETLITALISYARLLTGDKTLSPRSIGFMHEKPMDVSAYQSFFDCDVYFERPALFIEISRNLGSLVSIKSNPALGAILEQQAESMLDKLPKNKNDLLEEIKQKIKEATEAGKPTQEYVAMSLGVSSRTLHRKLAYMDEQFNQLLQDVRYQMAKHYLAEGKLPIAAIAHKVGYSEQSAFTRAFKKWSGMTPIVYAKETQSR